MKPTARGDTLAPPLLGLIFDCDGTLTDSMDLHFDAWRRTLERYGIPFTQARFLALAGIPTEQTIEILAAEHGVVVPVAEAAQAKEAAFLRLLPQLKPLAPVVEVVHRYQGSMKMAVASGGSRAVVMAQLVQIGLVEAFGAIVTAEDTARHKPHPDVFLEAARRLGCPPERCCVYEDADLGIEAAKRAGMRWVDVRQRPVVGFF